MRPLLRLCCLMAGLVLLAGAAAAETPLFMTKDKDGATVIEDRPPKSLDASPLTHRQFEEKQKRDATPDAAGSENMQGPSQTGSAKNPDEPHPLEIMQEDLPRIYLTPEDNPLVQMMLEQNPEFRKEWEKMSPDEQQELLRNMSEIQDSPEFQQGMDQLGRYVQYINLLIVVVALAYAMLAWFMAKISAPMGVGSFVEYLVPFWNMYLATKAADLSPWTFLLYFVPIINIFFVGHLFGKIAERLGRNYVGWAFFLTIGLIFFWTFIGLLPFFLMAKHAQNTMRRSLPEEFRPVI